MDLQFPHHENEIAQSEGAHGHAFVNYWMHNGFVRRRREDVEVARQLLHHPRGAGEFDRETMRFFILRAHYRSPLNYSDAHLGTPATPEAACTPRSKRCRWPRRPSTGRQPHAQRFKAAMDDDFNTPRPWPCCSNSAARSTAAKAPPPPASALKALGARAAGGDPRAFLQASGGQARRRQRSSNRSPSARRPRRRRTSPGAIHPCRADRNRRDRSRTGSAAPPGVAPDSLQHASRATALGRHHSRCAAQHRPRGAAVDGRTESNDPEPRQRDPAQVITGFQGLLDAARQQPEPQPCCSSSPAPNCRKATAEQRAKFRQGEGRALVPVMYRTKPDEAAELRGTGRGVAPPGQSWDMMFVGCLSGQGGREPDDDTVQKALETMIMSIQGGIVAHLHLPPERRAGLAARPGRRAGLTSVARRSLGPAAIATCVAPTGRHRAL